MRLAKNGVLSAGLMIVAVPMAFGQTINTVAGGFLTDGRSALSTSMVLPGGIALDAAGNLLIADTGNSVLRRVNVASGNTSIIGGGGQRLEDSLPIPAAQASIPRPRFVAADSNGNILFSDLSNRVRKLTPDNTVTTVAGTGTAGYSGDGGPAVYAKMGPPLGIALDSQGNLFIADCSNGVVRKLDASTGIIRTVAGNGTLGFSGDGGQATQASLNCPAGLAVDSSNNLYVVDALNNRLRKVNAQGIITTVMGNGTADLAPDRVPAGANYPLGNPWGVAVDAVGRVYLTERYGRVRRIGLDGVATILAGGGTSNGEAIPGTQAFVSDALQISLDSNANIYFADAGRNLIRKIDAGTGLIRTVAGSENVSDGIIGTQSVLSAPNKIALDTSGNLIIADRAHHRVRKLDHVTGVITTIAGTGQPGFSGDNGPATSAQLNFPTAVAVNELTGDIVISDQNNIRIRRINAATGVITTLVGNGMVGSAGDGGAATQSTVFIPEGLAFDSVGNLYFADSGNFTVRRVTASTNIISTVAGNRLFGYSGDGGPATAAMLSWPVDVALDRSGNLLIADRFANVVRRVNLSSNQITTIAGTGAFGYSGDGGPARSARMSGAEGLAVDLAGNIYVSEVFSHIVRKISLDGSISTFAGVSPPTGILGDGGLATLASISFPRGLAFDRFGSLFIADEGNSRIRIVSSAAVAPVLSVAPLGLSFNTVQGAAAPPAQQLRVMNSNFVRLFWNLQIVGSGTDWLTVSAAAGSAPAAPTVTVNPGNRAPGRYEATLIISAPGASNSPQTISVVMNVTGPSGPEVNLSLESLAFEGISGGLNPAPQGIAIGNSGSGTLAWRATAQTTGGNWLSLSAEAGNAPSNLFVSVNTRSLQPGVYQGSVRISDQQGSSSRICRITVMVSASGPSLLLSQKGLQFTAVEGASALPSQQFTVINPGTGVANWSVQATTSDGGSWLQVTPSSGSSDSSQLSASPTVTVMPNASGLLAGSYSGLITVSSSAAANSPQLISVLLRVLADGTSPPPVFSSTGLVFETTGSTAPVVRIVNLFVTGPPLSFAAAVATGDGRNWLSVTPASGRVQGAGSIAVQVNPAGLGSGVYRGTITALFSNGTAVDLGVLLISSSPTATTANAGSSVVPNCTAQDQFIVPTSLGNNFSVPTGWPGTVLAEVVDNCGESVRGAVVSVSFSNGDPTIVLSSIGSGIYSGTWNPRPSTSGVILKFKAVHPVLRTAEGDLSINLNRSTAPQIYLNGIVNAASFANLAPVAPGTIVSVFGENMAQGVFRSPNVPLESVLGGSSLRLGGNSLPLFFSSSGQVNAQIPSGIPENTRLSMVALVGGIFSTVENVTIASAQPGIFTLDQSGGGQGAVLNERNVMADQSSPAAVGETIQVYCTGLGATDALVSAGTATPAERLFRVINPVTAKIGGVDATVDFAGLSPGFVGLYQVNIIVPAGVRPGDSIPLQLFQAGQSSNVVTIAVH